MRKAYLLLDAASPRVDRLMRMAEVLHSLEYEPEIVEWPDERVVNSLDTQYGTDYPEYAAYAYVARIDLKRACKTDLIVATAPWHADIFRGLDKEERGHFYGAPIIELWVDYPESFARFRVFASECYRMWAVSEGQVKAWTKSCEDWIVSLPYYPLVDSCRGNMEVHSTVDHSLNHMEFMQMGIPIIAPEWGVWKETIEHGRSGILYRTERGRKTAEDLAYKISSQLVREAVEYRYNLRQTVDSLSTFFKGAVYAKT
jgi:hypothetical protein